jgi:peroxiredoxin
MVKTESTMLLLGSSAPEFSLKNVLKDNKEIILSQYAKNKPVVIAFICNHCPFVKHLIEKFSEIAQIYKEKGIAFIAISANDIEKYPDDSPKNMKIFAQENNFTFPYCYDETQEVAKAYKAACTPDFYLFDAQHRCYYRGQFDDSRPGNTVAITGDSLTSALDSLLENTSSPKVQKPSIGCNIKWKSE